MAGDEPTVDGAGARERRDHIRQRVVADGFVQIKELAEAYDVSVMTIHRDLDALQSKGWLRKVRGGATAQPSTMYHGDVHHRLQAMAEAKQELAEVAAELVSPGGSIMIDDSTTGLAVAELLASHGPLTVITNFLALVKRVAGEPGIDLIALGGAYYPAYDAFLGLRTCEAVRSLHADILFMSTTAITNGYCYHQSQETVAVKRALMDAADRRVLLIDHSKFTKNGLHRLAPLTDFDLVIVDAETPEHEITSQRSAGVPLHVAGKDPLPDWTSTTP